MVLSNNGQAITLKKDYAAAGYGNLAKARKVLGWTSPPFEIPSGIREQWRTAGERGKPGGVRWGRIGMLVR